MLAMAGRTYKETISAVFNVMVLLIITCLCCILHYLWKPPGYSDFFLSAFYCFFLLIIAIYQFRRLEIRADNNGLDVGYGMIRQRIAWESIESSSLDETRMVTPGYCPPEPREKLAVNLSCPWVSKGDADDSE